MLLGGLVCRLSRHSQPGSDLFGCCCPIGVLVDHRTDVRAFYVKVNPWMVKVNFHMTCIPF
jgi:hypothetical protein